MWELLPLVAIVVVFWLFVIRPAQRRQRSQIELQQSLTVGDEVMLTSGFYGRLRALDDDRLQVALTDDVVVTVARAAVAHVVPPAETSDAEPAGSEQHELPPTTTLDDAETGPAGSSKEG